MTHRDRKCSLSCYQWSFPLPATSSKSHLQQKQSLQSANLRSIDLEQAILKDTHAIALAHFVLRNKKPDVSHAMACSVVLQELQARAGRSFLSWMMMEVYECEWDFPRDAGVSTCASLTNMWKSSICCWVLLSKQNTNIVEMTEKTQTADKTF